MNHFLNGVARAVAEAASDLAPAPGDFKVGLAYTREVIAQFLEADDLRTTVECLFGDVAARSLGFTPRGLSPSAGLALALDGARRPNVSTT